MLSDDAGKLFGTLLRLIEAAKPFLDDSIVTETTGTIPLLEALESAIEDAEQVAKESE